MKSESKQRPKSRALRRLKRIFLILCVVSTIGVVYVQHGVYSYEQQVAEDIIYRIGVELARQEELRQEIEYNLSDMYIERVAREQWGLLKSHEIVFININN